MTDFDDTRPDQLDILCEQERRRINRWFDELSEAVASFRFTRYPDDRL